MLVCSACAACRALVTIACGLLCSNAAALPAKTNGYIRVDCYGGLNQMRRDVSTLNISHYVMVLVLYFKFGFTDVFDVDYFIQQLKGFIEVVKELPAEIASREPVRVDCSKRKGQFDYVETVLPSLLKHRYISITPAMSQRRDRFPLYGKAALCQACYSALRLTSALEKKSDELLEAIPKPFLALHLRFEPNMVAYSQCEYNGLLPSSMEAIDASRRERKPWTGETARGIPIMELEGLTSVYSNVVTKSSLLSGEDFKTMHGNTKAALDYYVSINSDAYAATYFGNMDKMVAAMRAYKGLYKTLFLSRKAFADFTSQGLKGKELMEALRKAHRDDYVMGRGSALPDCFCDFQL
ncbi:O-fucosyltransferase 13 isoform X1 [Tanacetum coccineum]